MEIKLNGFYKTRDGRKARVICVDRKFQEKPIVALIADPKTGNENVEFNYLKSGYNRVGMQSYNDLVEEWVEPREFWITIPDDGHSLCAWDVKTRPSRPGLEIIKVREVLE